MKKVNLAEPFLGPLDADADEHLLSYYVPFGDFSQLLGKNKFVVVGAKGTGKSAIKNYIVKSRGQKKQMAVVLDNRYSLDLEQIGTTSPAEIKNKIKGYLTSIVIDEVINDASIPKEKKKKLIALKDDISIFQRLLMPLKIRPPFSEYAIKDLFPPEKRSDLLMMERPEVIAAVKEALGSRDIWLFVDDVDKVFTSRDRDNGIRFIEGVIYASSEINFRTYKPQIFVVVFLRSEAYDALRRSAEEMDKQIGYVRELSWGAEALEEFLARRIEWSLEAEPKLQSWQYWSMVFDSSDQEDTKELQNWIIARVINGPRDLLLLVDLARARSYKLGTAKIGWDQLKEIEVSYGKEKLTQISANFRDVYKDIDRVVDCLFRRKQSRFNKNELEDLINDTLLTSAEAGQAFQRLSWVATATPFRIIEVLYRAGVIGYWDKSQQCLTTSLMDAEPDDRLVKASSFSLHPAFHRILEVQS